MKISADRYDVITFEHRAFRPSAILIDTVARSSRDKAAATSLRSPALPAAPRRPGRPPAPRPDGSGCPGSGFHERLPDAEHPHGAGDAGWHLGQSDDETLGIGRDAVVTGQRDLQTAAEGGTVDRRDDRLGQLLQRAQVRLDRLDGVEDRFSAVWTDGDQVLEVAAGRRRSSWRCSR